MSPLPFSSRAGITPSVGAVGSGYDNALAETINGLYKTEVIRRLGPWRGDVPPVELEHAHCHQNQPPTEAA
jgi:putative transposase